MVLIVRVIEVLKCKYVFVLNSNFLNSYNLNDINYIFWEKGYI